MKEIRVVEVVTGLGAGGAEIALLSRLRKTPLFFNSVIFNLRPEIDAIVADPGIEVVNFKTILGLFPISIVSALKEFNPSIVIVRTPLDLIRFALLKLLMRNHRWKLVFEAHSNFVSSRPLIKHLLTFLLRLTRPLADWIIAVSENVKMGPLCNSSSKCSVVYLGAEPSTFAEDFSQVSGVKLLFVGRFVSVKRPLDLVRAIRLLNEQIPLPNGFLTMVGDGVLKKETENYVRQHQLTKIVHIVGFQNNLARYYHENTHLVSVSSNEGLPISFYEAKLSGLRIISTPSGGGHEIFDQNDHLLSTFDLNEFVSHLLLIAKSKVTAESRLEIAVQSSWMTVSICSENYYKVLKQVASS